MSKLDTEMFLNGRVAGYQYQLRIVITYGEDENLGEMIVFDSFGRSVDKFRREFHHQYHREFIKQSMARHRKSPGRSSRVKGAKVMGNELTIRVTTGDEEEDNEQIDKILRVLQDAEEEGEIDFAFNVIRNQYPR